MILTSTQNNHNFDKIAQALIDQHPKIHTSERVSHQNKPEHNKFKFQDRGTRPRRQWGSQRQGHLSRREPETDLEEEDSFPVQDSSSESDDVGRQAHQARAARPADDYSGADEYSTTVEDVEMDVYTCMLCNSEDIDDETVAFLVQSETTALVAWSKKGKGKGKEKGMRRAKYSTGLRPKMSLEERKASLKKLKQRTKCSACGQIGHWVGDPE